MKTNHKILIGVLVAGAALTAILVPVLVLKKGDAPNDVSQVEQGSKPETKSPAEGPSKKISQLKDKIDQHSNGSGSQKTAPADEENETPAAGCCGGHGAKKSAASNHTEDAEKPAEPTPSDEISETPAAGCCSGHGAAKSAASNGTEDVEKPAEPTAAPASSGPDDAEKSAEAAPVPASNSTEDVEKPAEPTAAAAPSAADDVQQSPGPTPAAGSEASENIGQSNTQQSEDQPMNEGVVNTGGAANAGDVDQTQNAEPKQTAGDDTRGAVEDKPEAADGALDGRNPAVPSSTGEAREDSGSSATEPTPSRDVAAPADGNGTSAAMTAAGSESK